MKIIVFKRRGMFLFALFLLICAVGINFFSNGVVRTVKAVSGKIPIYAVKTDQRKIAVTFDMAWDSTDTEQIIEILNRHNAKATFFVVGQWAEKYPEQLKTICLAGHEIGNHSYSHKLYTSVNAETVGLEMDKCNEIVEKITGQPVTLCRAPSGAYSETALREAEKRDMFMIQWSVDSRDWMGKSEDEIVGSVTEKSGNGDILLFHNGVKNTPAALERILSVLSDRGYEFVTVSELIYKDGFTVAYDGRQIKND